MEKSVLDESVSQESKSQETKRRIIEAARDVYLELGLSGVSMRQVASVAGMSTMATYRHFENKNDLIGHVIVEGFRIFQQYFNRALAGTSAVERLWWSARTYLDFGLDHPKYYEVMFMSLVQLKEIQFQTSGQQQINTAMRFLCERVEECIAAGEMDAGDTMELTHHLWAHSHGLISLYLAGRLKNDMKFEDLYERSIAVVFRGLGVPNC